MGLALGQQRLCHVALPLPVWQSSSSGRAGRMIVVLVVAPILHESIVARAHGIPIAYHKGFLGSRIANKSGQGGNGAGVLGKSSQRLSPLVTRLAFFSHQILLLRNDRDL